MMLQRFEHLLSALVKSGSNSQCWSRGLSTSSSVSHSAVQQQGNSNNSANTTTFSSCPVALELCKKNAFQLQTLSPMIQSVRHGGKPNTRRPKIPHKEKAVALALTLEQYKYPLEGLPATQTCINAVRKSVGVSDKKENPFERILSRELLEMVEAAEVVVVVHRHSCNSEDLFDMRIQLHRNNMKYLYYNNAMVRMAFENSKYQNLMPLYTSNTATIICYDKDITKLLRMERKLPYMTILAASMEGRILSVTQLREVAALPQLPLVRATLLSTLNAQQQRLKQNLQHHQSELSGALSRHAAPPSTDADAATTVTSKPSL